jgi:hypothetical protein
MIIYAGKLQGFSTVVDLVYFKILTNNSSKSLHQQLPTHNNTQRKMNQDKYLHFKTIVNSVTVRVSRYFILYLHTQQNE